MRLWRFVLPCVVVLISMAGPHGAHAGAWLQEEGRGQAIATLAAAQAREAFDETGARMSVPPSRSDHLDMLVEYGWSEALTLRAKLAAGRWRNDVGDRAQGAGVQEAGARLALVSHGRWVSSLEASLLVAEAHGNAQWRAGFDARVLAGRSLEIVGRPAFVEMQLGIAESPGAAAALVADATLGVRPLPSTLVLVQSFSRFDLSVPQAPVTRVESTRLKASVVFDVSARWSVQAGVETSLAGAGVAAEQGLVAALWWRF